MSHRPIETATKNGKVCQHIGGVNQRSPLSNRHMIVGENPNLLSTRMNSNHAANGGYVEKWMATANGGFWPGATAVRRTEKRIATFVQLKAA